MENYWHTIVPASLQIIEGKSTSNFIAADLKRNGLLLHITVTDRTEDECVHPILCTPTSTNGESGPFSKLYNNMVAKLKRWTRKEMISVWATAVTTPSNAEL